MAWCPRCGKAHFSTHLHRCRDTKSAPAALSSLPSGESDPSVTLDYTGADTVVPSAVGTLPTRDCACDTDHPTFKERGHHPLCPQAPRDRV